MLDIPRPLKVESASYENSNTLSQTFILPLLINVRRRVEYANMVVNVQGGSVSGRSSCYWVTYIALLELRVYKRKGLGPEAQEDLVLESQVARILLSRRSLSEFESRLPSPVIGVCHVQGLLNGSGLW